MVVNGINQKILRVNLSDGSFKEETYSDADARKYLGGSTMGAKFILEKVKADTDPLSAENLLIFGIGPLCMNFTASSRYAVCAKSPLTGIWGEASSGGRFAHLMKKSGFDFLRIRQPNNMIAKIYYHLSSARKFITELKLEKVKEHLIKVLQIAPDEKEAIDVFDRLQDVLMVMGKS